MNKLDIAKTVGIINEQLNFELSTPAEVSLALETLSRMFLALSDYYGEISKND